MQERLAQLQDMLWTHIPITRQLGLKVDTYDGQRLCFTAPLTANVNHAGTVFAGSLNALLTLTGWGMTWLLMQELELAGEIVIQDSSCRYLAPVTQDFVTICARPQQQSIEQFVRMLRRRGRGRLELKVDIVEGTTTVVSFTGRYVVHNDGEQHNSNSPYNSNLIF
ncbi:YiiD C-terminal domain-containing protein [Ktedonobacter racemifer]|uniref:Thioesterase domain protein n=1 Tax=Ktedonobacter racemifer DSM 44963 TaxID=485913 RepID=D6TZC6_KTERA|nr:YiiD C-terminal domain-containing protein [Ktedonobacter racemifer]EFH81916.1 thioesterase domain protein [Ktedonobacter racemifer DSM 44963]